MRDLDHQATLLFASRLVNGGEVQPLTPARFWALLESVPKPGELLTAPENQIADMTKLREADADALRRLLEPRTALALVVDELEQQGIRALTPFDDEYPQRLLTQLGTQAPPVLFYAGDVQLLETPAVGIVGSRDVDAAAVEVAKDAARASVGRGCGVVSGGARGIDQVAMQVAHEDGGVVVGAIADALSKRLRDSQTRAAVLDGGAVLVTPFHPDAGFTVQGAMGRNKMIYALAQVTLVVSTSSGKGGTWAGATEALKRDYGRVAVWTGTGKGAGNDGLVELGARPVDTIEALFAIDGDQKAGRDPQQLGFAL